jgi:hypothetical protein
MALHLERRGGLSPNRPRNPVGPIPKALVSGYTAFQARRETLVVDGEVRAGSQMDDGQRYRQQRAE